jgi:hypothetical protein
MLAAVLIVVAATLAAALGVALAFDRRLGGEIDALLADSRPSTVAAVTPEKLDTLPQPVQRWLRHSNVVGTTVPRTVRLRQDGQFRMEGRGWMPFDAEQYFTIDPPGFLWKAAFRMAPMMVVKGRDRYRAGEGSVEMRILSLVPVAKASGGGLDQGALLRFLGELQWFPAAAVADYVVWQAIDAESCRATMAYGGISASMIFRFSPDGRLIESAATRYNDSRKRNEQWVNRNEAEQEIGGVRVPVSGEARWEYDSGPYPYIRWYVTAIEHDRASRF